MRARSRSAPRRRSTISAGSPATTWQSRCGRRTSCGPIPGVRPLFDDGDDDPSAVTRDYHLEVDGAVGTAPLLSVFGGKITTYRRLAEHALRDLAPHYPHMGVRMDRRPGAGRRRAGRCADLRGRRSTTSWTPRPSSKPGLPKELLRVLARRHGVGIDDLLKDVKTVADLGAAFRRPSLRGRGALPGARRMGGRGRGR